ncbi:hypothetical protein MNBD_BACTEROID04-540, partial [hydrothermal vent metagenome]
MNQLKQITIQNFASEKGIVNK